jgi:biopolymer transport protein ExbD
MGMSVGENKGGAMAEMNVVPLIDILLVLLIIFMVITPLTPKGMDTLVPQPNPNQQQNQDLENKTVVVQIDKNGKARINNEDATGIRWATHRAGVQGPRRKSRVR